MSLVWVASRRTHKRRRARKRPNSCASTTLQTHRTSTKEAGEKETQGLGTQTTSRSPLRTTVGHLRITPTKRHLRPLSRQQVPPQPHPRLRNQPIPPNHLPPLSHPLTMLPAPDRPGPNPLITAPSPPIPRTPRHPRNPQKTLPAHQIPRPKPHLHLPNLPPPLERAQPRPRLRSLATTPRRRRADPDDLARPQPGLEHRPRHS